MLIVNLASRTLYCRQERKLEANEDILKYIESYQLIFNKKVSENDLTYIKANIASTELALMINKWEDGNHRYLTEEAKSILLIDYLNIESNFIIKGVSKEKIREAGLKSIESFLNETKDSLYVERLENIILDKMDFGPVVASPMENIYGDLYVSSNPSEANVFIDGKKQDNCTNNTWVLIVGKHSLSIKKENYHDCGKEVLIEKKKTIKFHCELQKKVLA